MAKQQEKDRREFEIKHRIPTDDTPEHWRVESRQRINLSDVRDWTPSSTASSRAASVELRDEPDSPSPKSKMKANRSPSATPLPVLKSKTWLIDSATSVASTILR